MTKHYRFTEAMTFLIDTDKKTICIVGSYKQEDLQEAKDTIFKDYLGYLIINEKLTETSNHSYYTNNED